jgi:hypothetical protein
LRCRLQIEAANGGAWPVSLMEWRRVCRAFGLRIVWIRARCGSRFRGALVGSDVLVRWTRRPGAAEAVLAHEVAEWLLRAELRERERLEAGCCPHLVAEMVGATPTS